MICRLHFGDDTEHAERYAIADGGLIDVLPDAAALKKMNGPSDGLGPFAAGRSPDFLSRHIYPGVPKRVLTPPGVVISLSVG